MRNLAGITDDKDIVTKDYIPTKVSDFTNDSGFITGMTILSYGSSTWQNFIDAYNANKVVYCRASSNANPASGSQTRLAFMAYVNNATTPTNVEFQYYRSVSSHSASQQGDQVFVYKLDKTSGWSVTTREASVKIKINTNNEGIKTTYSSGTVSIGHANSVTAQTTQAVYPIAYDAQGHITSSGTAVTIPTQASDIGAQPTLVSGINIKTINNNSILGSGNIDIQGAYIVTFTYDESEDVYTCDKTSQEIYEACISGENIVGVSYSGDPTSGGEFYDCKYVSKEVEGSINYYYAKFCSVEVEGGHAGSLILFVSNSGVRYESDFIYPITNIEGENWSNTITLDNGEGTASIQMNDRILDKTATIYWSTGDGANDSSTITLEAEKIGLDANEILASSNYTPTLARHLTTKGYVDTAISNSSEIFLIEVSYDGVEEDYVSNKTFSQIQAAITANKTLLLHYIDEDRFYQCNAYGDHDIDFYCLIGNTYYFIIIYNNNSIEIDDQSYNNDRLKWSSTTSSNTYYPLVGAIASDVGGLGITLNGVNFYQYYNTAGGYRRLDLGNTTAYKLTGGAYGTIRLYGAAATYYGDLVPGVLGTTSGDGHISANRTWTLPDKTGTIALTSDLAGKQDTLVYGTNIKTINNNSILGSGDITIASDSKNIWYGTCASSSSAENKIVTTISEDFDFQIGSMLRVLFEDANSQPEPYLTVDNGQAGTILRLGTHQVTILSIDRITTSTGSSQNYVYNLPSSAITSGENFSAIININSPANSQDVYSDTVVFTAGQSASYQLFPYQNMYVLIEYNGSTSSPQILLRSLYSWSINFWGSVKTGGDTVKSLVNYWHAGAVLDFVYDGSRFILSDGGTNYSHDITGTYNSTTKDLTLSVTMS